MTSEPNLISPKPTSSKLTKSKHSKDKVPKKTSNMCDCNKQNQSDPQKESHSAQTDSQGIDFGALLGGMVNGVGGMMDGVGPWLPYIGGSALFIMLLGYMAKNIDSFLGMFESDFKYDEKPSILAPSDAPLKPPPPETIGDVLESQHADYETKEPSSCVCRINRKRIKWPM